MFDLSALIGIVLGLFIGFISRWFNLPLPAPLKLVGALLVVATTLGFTAGNAIG